MPVSITEYSKALASLIEVMNEKKTKIVRDAAIQRFEFTVELAWKSAKKLMGTSTTSPKDVMREMAQNNYITDIDLWLKSIDQRNLSSHTYNENLAEEVYSFIQVFIPHAKKLEQKFLGL